MGQVLVGTASWTDKSLIASGWYPPEVKTAQERLRFYADRFRVVEVDSSYYALPTARNAQLWSQRTHEGFVFDVKAFRLFTGHHTPPEALPKDIREAVSPSDKKNLYYRDLPEEITGELWRRFVTALDPLKQAEKLGAILLQFPPWFVFGHARLQHILNCVQKLAGYRVAVEFRNHTWFDQKHRSDVLAFAREHDLVHVVVDEPQGFSSSVPAVWEVTCPQLAIVRFHGRNRETWMKKGLASAADRFKYLYSVAELSELARSVGEIAAHAVHVHALFNNCYLDYGTRNAAQLVSLLEQLDQEPS